MTNLIFGPSSNITSLKVLDLLAWACRSQKILCGTLDADEELLALPPIQRSAVWRPRQVLAFWDSLLSNLPVGMFYLIEETRPREIVVNNKIQQTTHHGYDLLDGQQRLRALALGASDPFNQRRCLWVTFLREGYELRLTSKTQPFGYDKYGNKLSLQERRAARAAIEPDPSTLRFAEGAQTRPVYDADLFDNPITKNNTTLPTPPYPYKCHPVDTAQLSDLLSKWKTEQSESALQTLVPEAPAAAVAKLHTDFVKLAEAEIPLMRLRGSRFEGSQGKADLMKLFARIGAGGTTLSAEEQLYSAYKLHYPAARNAIERIHDTVSAILPSAKIVGMALRIARVQGPTNPAVIPDLQTFTTAMDALDGEPKLMMDRLKCLLPPNSDTDTGDLYHASWKVKQLLGGDGQGAFWIPDVMLADLPPELWEVLVLWATLSPSADLADSRKEAVRFALFWHLCIFNQERAVRDSFRLILQLHEMRQLNDFPGLKLYYQLTGAGGKASAISILGPDKIQQMFLAGATGSKWLDENSRFGAGESRNHFAIEWWYAVRMLPWLQRDYVTRAFPGYKPLSDHEDDLPYDKDHICAQNHWAYDGRSTVVRFDVSVTPEDTRSMRSARYVVGNAIGNLRLVDSSVNRSLGDDLIVAKMPFLGEQFNPEKGKPEDFAFDFADPDNLWRQADEPRDVWSADRLRAFQAAVGQRTAQLYQRFFEQLGYSGWLK